MNKKIKNLGFVLTVLLINHIAQAEKSVDTIIAESSIPTLASRASTNTTTWVVVQEILGQSGLAILEKKEGGVTTRVGASEDIYTVIENNVDRENADNLATQLVEKEIERQGGIEKTQQNFDEQTEKYGKNFFNYLCPLAKRAYKNEGISLPIRGNGGKISRKPSGINSNSPDLLNPNSHLPAPSTTNTTYTSEASSDASYSTPTKHSLEWK